MSKFLEELKIKVQNCQRCDLGKTRNKTVFGEGSPKADIVLIGEGPGQKEDESGKPFVGAAGKLLDEMIKAIDLTRKEVYIANIIKCRPPGNRDPLPNEIKACWPYLEKQLGEIKPKLIVLLGRHSLEKFLPGQKISQVHGKALRRNFPKLGNQVFFAVYHPAAALYQQSLKETLFKDFRRIPKVLKKLKEGKDDGIDENGAKESKNVNGKTLNKMKITVKQNKLF
jgi:uracil-DNA glycosylase